MTCIPASLDFALSYLRDEGFDVSHQEIIAAAGQLDSQTYNLAAKYKDDFIHDLFKLSTDAALSEAQPNSPDLPHDYCFEVLMRRFDFLLPYRPLLKDIYLFHTWALDHQKLVSSMLACERTLLKRVYALSPHILPINESAFIYFYFTAFVTWLEDDSPGFSKTMATLDTQISKFEALITALPKE